MNIVITGASKGIGKAIAIRYSEDKNNIFICARNEEELAASALEIQQTCATCRVLHLSADLSDKKSTDSFIQWIENECGVVDILINNAGQFIPGSVYNEEKGNLEKMIAINLYSAYQVTRGLLPGMIQNKNGHIFNVCSIAALKAYDNGGSYSISKYALMGFSKNLREEMKPYNIKVTTIYPGAVHTSSWEGSDIDPNRIMEANDISEMVYAASKLSPQACVEDIIIRPLKGDL